MPVDKSKPSSSKSHLKRKDPNGSEYVSQNIPGASGLTHARELEVKRSRGEVSCAELKIKCDKQIPCQSCIRRGCAALCPNGALATGQGTRFVLAATEHLHRKISRMSERIRLLEDALGSLHADTGGPDSVHPLLLKSEDFSLPDEPPMRRQGSEVDDGVGGEEGSTGSQTNGEVIDAFGTLSISDFGISRFFGPTGGSEVRILIRAYSFFGSQMHQSLLLSNTTPTSDSSGSPSSYLSRNSKSRSPATSHTSSPISPPTAGPPSSTFSPGHISRHSHSSSSDSPTHFCPTSFPLTPLGPLPDIHALVTSHLPRRRCAMVLVDAYLTQLGWLFHLVSAEQAHDTVRAVYRVFQPDAREAQDEKRDEDGSGEEDYTGPHDIALLFLLFAVGTLVSAPNPGEESDAHQQRINAESFHMHQVARAALTMQSILEKPSIVTVQALHLLSVYISISTNEEDGDTSMETTWSLVRIASHLSQTIGLHRDSARWGLSAKMNQRRRRVFWDIFTADAWMSMHTGRPPTFSLAYIDCPLPSYEGVNTSDEIFEVWQFRFAADCVAEVTARTLTAEAPTYATIMELDRKVREFPLPSNLKDPSPDDMGASMQRCIYEHVRETVLMYIHRSFFAQAIIDQPENPLKSLYAPSFLAAYRASSTILKSVKDQYAVMPTMCARFWTMWTFAFSAAVVFGTVVTRGPRSPLAGAAMTELDSACLLFSKAAVYGRRATRALPVLMKLQEKAKQALHAVQNEPSGTETGFSWSMSGVLGPDGQPMPIKTEEHDELAIIAGHTRLVSGGQNQRSISQASSSSSSSASSAKAFPSILPVQPPSEELLHTPERYRHRPPLSSYHQPMDDGPLIQSMHHQLSSRAPLIQNEWTSQARSHHHHEPYREERAYYPSDGRVLPEVTSNAQTHFAWSSQYSSRQAQHPYHPQQQQQQQQSYAADYSQQHAQLAHLGMASGDSRLDDRWTSFMQDSGLMEGSGDYRAR
ncbi:unnamed protein product [Mycena citricolor]|uniref:4Fe-4S ferredoxin-type domain-containing protein n=1 Tax=Mycena citricolor TaxID=2018698 RepID=A0AAD2HF84_9AGAR|nr:unnamed protein product [Mycena citricolor]